jgi:hypothetical protein
MSPNIAVDAPTLYASGLNVQPKSTPPNEEMKYRVASFQLPRPFSSPEPMTMVESKFRQRCVKEACRKTGVMNRHTCPLFLIFLASFHPSVSNAFGFGARNSVLTILLSHNEMRYMMISIMMISTVNVQHLIVGHKFI